MVIREDPAGFHSGYVFCLAAVTFRQDCVVCQNSPKATGVIGSEGCFCPGAFAAPGVGSHRLIIRKLDLYEMKRNGGTILLVNGNAGW
jgi:hypothetical protein